MVRVATPIKKNYGCDPYFIYFSKIFISSQHLTTFTHWKHSSNIRSVTCVCCLPSPLLSSQCQHVQWGAAEAGRQPQHQRGELGCGAERGGPARAAGPRAAGSDPAQKERGQNLQQDGCQALHQRQEVGLLHRLWLCVPTPHPVPPTTTPRSAPPALLKLLKWSSVTPVLDVRFFFSEVCSGTTSVSFGSPELPICPVINWTGREKKQNTNAFAKEVLFSWKLDSAAGSDEKDQNTSGCLTAYISSGRCGRSWMLPGRLLIFRSGYKPCLSSCGFYKTSIADWRWYSRQPWNAPRFIRHKSSMEEDFIFF